MSVTRVYHPTPLHAGAEVVLEARAAHHLLRVLRLREGDDLVLFDGSGGEWQAVLAAADRRGVRVRLDRFDPVERESPLAVTLAQVVSSGERMDYTVQKAVELGVRHVQPLMAPHGKVRLSDERAERRVEHWQRVAAAACEQCGRNRVPRVAPVADLYDWVAASASTAARWLLTPRAGESLRTTPHPPGSVALLAGAEAGFTIDEESFICAAGFVPVRLGPRTLRTETAAAAALAAMQVLWGDL